VAAHPDWLHIPVNDSWIRAVPDDEQGNRFFAARREKRWSLLRWRRGG
jgi:hypothetical protein